MSKCPTCGRVPKRSSESNRRYWALLAVLSERLKVKDIQYGRQVWHEYMKEKFLGASEIELPNGKKRIISESSASLDVSEFNDFMSKVEVWCGEHNVWLDE